MSELCLPFFGGRLRVSPFVFVSCALALCFEGVVPLIIMLAAALVHEGGHAAAIYAFNSRIGYVEVHAVGAVIHYDSSTMTYRREAAVSLAGPAANFLFASLGMVLFAFLPCVEVLLFVFACLFFALFNLLPLRGNDGSTALYALLAAKHGVRRAERVVKAVAFAASAVGAAAATALYALSGACPAVAVLFLMAMA